jgi:hypothetical protein
MSIPLSQSLSCNSIVSLSSLNFIHHIVNQVLIDHDGTASTDFDDKTKTSPQMLAVIGKKALLWLPPLTGSAAQRDCASLWKRSTVL